MAVAVDLSPEQQAELRALTNSAEVPAVVGTRARIVLWHAEGRRKKDIAVLAGVSRPTVDLWLGRYAADGASGLLGQQPGAPREQVPADVRSRVLALTRTTPPVDTGPSRYCRSSSTQARNAPTTTCSTAPPTCSPR